AGQAAKEAGAGGQAAQQAATGAQQSAEQVQQVAQDVEEPLGDPFDFRLAAVVAPGAEGSANFTVPAGQRLALTDIVLQNPQGNRGALQIKRGDAGILLEVRLENFRDLDYHFVAPILFQERQQVVLTVRCENAPPAPNAPAGPCNPASYFSGFIKVPPPPPPAPARNS
ncbi:MAG: hypothetical protein M3N52_13535, partial [Actinomycetota bacterium]|nr:hypothetical protein [Actinomycetota bacterium]